MSNSYKSVEEILDDYRKSFDISKQLIGHDVYFAHTPTNTSRDSKETLAEHIDLVQNYFLMLVQKHNINAVIDQLINNYLTEIDLNSRAIGDHLKELFVHNVCYHDHGKVNENFQITKMRNSQFYGKENTSSKIGTKHSTLSSFIFLSHKIDNCLTIPDVKSQGIMLSLSVLFSYAIYKHHSYGFEDEFIKQIKNEAVLANDLNKYLKLFRLYEENSEAPSVLIYLDRVLDKLSFEKYACSYPLYQLMRLNFSLLTASDYLATNDYMNGREIGDYDNFGTLTNKRIIELHKRISTQPWFDEEKTKRNFNRKTYDELGTIKLEQPKEKSNPNLNLLRQQMATEAIHNVRNNIGRELFYIEAPTGGGKTNISLLVALELLKENEHLNKVFYVFPFTTLVDQTYKSIKESLGLLDEEIVALHSKAPFQKEGTEDDMYGDAKKNYVNHLFINYPFCLLTHVRFFDIIKTNLKEINYLLHRLTNSIVIIDELQSYNPQHWDKIMYFIKQYADTYNMKFIIMSATLPKIHQLEIEGVNSDEVVSLIPNAKKDYFQNENFAKRVHFDFDFLEDGKISLNKLAKTVLAKSIEYAPVVGGKAKPKGSVYTIIEFIFKKSATEFSKQIESIHKGFFDKIFVLSGTILPHRRCHIINFIKRPENRKKKILLITTQVVEAGVDIDMDLGFKDTSILDSDEQLAGRINRNVNKQNCKLYLFNLDKQGVIYGDDLRYALTREMTLPEKKEILEKKEFDLLYRKVIDFKDKRNKDSNFQGLGTYTSYIENLQFKSVNDQFKLIEQNNISCFIPLHIPVEIEGEKVGSIEKIFTTPDLVFLEKNGVYPTQKNTLNGEEVYNLYCQIIEKQIAFHDKKIELKQLQSILSKFVFSLFATQEIERKISEYADIEKSEYGFMYLHRWNEIYSAKSGLDSANFDKIETQFL